MLPNVYIIIVLYFIRRKSDESQLNLQIHLRFNPLLYHFYMKGILLTWGQLINKN